MLRRWTTLVTVALLAVASTARSTPSYTVLPPQDVLEAMPAYRYAQMSEDEALAELDRRGVPYHRVAPVPGVRTPVRFTAPLHGVHIHSSLPEEERTGSVFEILDARLALAVDDFAALLERHDIVELVHFTMYRPNLPKPDPAQIAAPAAARSPAGAAARNGRDDLADKAALAPGKHRRSRHAGTKQKRGPGDEAKQPPAQRSKPAAKPAATTKPAARPTETKPATEKRTAKPAATKPAAAKPAAAKPATAKPATAKSATAKSATAKSVAAKPATAKSVAAKPAKTKPATTKAAAAARAEPESPTAAPPEPAPKKKVTWAPPGTRHPAGLAIDAGGFRKRDGRWLGVAAHFDGHIGDQTCGSGARRPASPEAQELRSIVCEVGEQGIFSYVLSPNHDEPHVDHLHMEIKPAARWVMYH